MYPITAIPCDQYVNTYVLDTFHHNSILLILFWLSNISTYYDQQVILLCIPP